MNKTYRLIWSDSRQDWIVAPELANSRGKPASRAKRLLAAVAGVLLSQSAWAQGIDPGALPNGGQVAAGQAAISQAGSTMTIKQGSDKAIINWNSFNIGSQAGVQFQQPSSSSVALNRVSSSAPSVINGSLTANGQLFLINPNGVLFGQGSRVDVGGLVASSLNMSNSDFLNGNYQFNRNGANGSVINQGELLGQYIALLAPEVVNEGVIAAQQGTVALAGGEAVTLSITGNRLIDVQVDKASIDTLVENKHFIQADEGTVIMSAQSANGLLGQVVNTGAIEANGIVSDGGTVRLLASSSIAHSGSISADGGENGNGGSATLIADLSNPESSTTVSGSISAKGGANGGDGGFIETSASHLGITSSASIDTSAANSNTGQWLLDPYDFTVAAVGGDITGNDLSSFLATTNVTIQTSDTSASSCDISVCYFSNSTGNGDIFINDSVSWSSNYTLTLSAWNSIEINAPISASGAGGGLNLEFGQSDVEFSFPAGNYFVNAKVDLAAGTTFTTKYASDGTPINYTVITDQAGLANIDADMAGYYVLGANIATTGSWTPLGNSGGDVFFATGFDGVLDGLNHTIDGLTQANTANATGVGLFGNIGMLGLVQNVGLTNVNLDGLAYVGALAGINNGVVHNVYASGSVTGSDAAGVGFNTGTNDDNVGAVGGLIGSNSGLIDSSYANVTVTATTGIQSTGGMTDGGIGGLVGLNDGSISDVYAMGDVSGVRDVGGLVGWTMGSIFGAYATGTVTGTTNVGGFAGALSNPFSQPLLFDTYWSSTVGSSASDFMNSSTHLDAATTAKQQSSYTGFDFTNSWIMYEDGAGLPLLRSMLTPMYVTADDITTTYAGTAFTGFTSNISGGATSGVDYSGTVTYTPSTANPTNVGTYTVTTSGLTIADKTNQHGYRIEYVAGSLTIDPATLTVTADDKTRTYGSANPTFTTTISGYVNGEDASSAGVTGAASASSTATAATAVGTAAITADVGTLAASNYTFTAANGTLTIDPALLTVTADNYTRTYGSANPTFTTTISGYVNGEDAGSAGVTGAATASSTATSTSPAADYTITADVGTLAASNYTFTPVNGTLTITEAAKTISSTTILGTTITIIQSGSTVNFKRSSASNDDTTTNTSGNKTPVTTNVTGKPIDIFVAVVLPNDGGIFMKDSDGSWKAYDPSNPVSISTGNTSATPSLDLSTDMKLINEQIEGAKMYVGFGDPSTGNSWNNMLNNGSYNLLDITTPTSTSTPGTTGTNSNGSNDTSSNKSSDSGDTTTSTTSSNAVNPRVLDLYKGYFQAITTNISDVYDSGSVRRIPNNVIQALDQAGFRPNASDTSPDFSKLSDEEVNTIFSYAIENNTYRGRSFSKEDYVAYLNSASSDHSRVFRVENGKIVSGPAASKDGANGNSENTGNSISPSSDSNNSGSGTSSNSPSHDAKGSNSETSGSAMATPPVVTPPAVTPPTVTPPTVTPPSGSPGTTTQSGSFNTPPLEIYIEMGGGEGEQQQ